MPTEGFVHFSVCGRVSESYPIATQTTNYNNTISSRCIGLAIPIMHLKAYLFIWSIQRGLGWLATFDVIFWRIY